MISGSADMPAWMDDDLVIFRDAVDRFIERECLPHLEEWDAAGAVPREIWRKAGEAGLLMASAPAEYGGGGASFAYDVVITERLSRFGAHGFSIPVQNCIFAPYLVHIGSEEQKRKWIPRFASGEWIGAIAMSEPGAGSDLKALRCTAVRDGDSYVINGQKIFTTLGMQADLLMVACRTGEQGSGGISLFFVETNDCPGFTRGRKLDKIGLNAHATAELFFADVRIPASNLVGEVEGQGFTQMMFNLAQERLIVAIESSAMIERAVAETVAYVKDRKAFGKTVMDFQNTQFVLADCKTESVVGKAFVNQCIEEHLQGTLDPVTAAMAKLWLSETQGKVIDRCLQLFGGYGYINEYPIAHMYRDSRVSRIYGGTSEIMRLIVARSLQANG
jgi:acyl-CoA dehydrogenase